jgi:alpha-tubulin suppressor-like RCC1 family protein
MAVKSDGTLWAWGANDKGQLGDGTTYSKTSPVEIGAANNWTAAACGSAHTVAIKNDGSLWAWGWNGWSQLGDGTTTQRTSPVRIGTSVAWGALPLCLGYQFSAVLTLDGTLWTCGDHSLGELANYDPTVPHRTSPPRIPQTLTFSPLPSLTIGQPVALSAASDSQIPVTYGVAGPATLSGNILTRTAAGAIQIMAWQAGDDTWASTEPQALAPPTVITTAPTVVTATTATLNGTVNPGGLATTAQFEYGFSTAYGSTASVALSPNNGTSVQAVSAVLTGLVPGTTYHYRLTATNSLGSPNGADQTFFTGPVIAVEQPAGTGLASGSSSIDFGSTSIGGAGSTLTFTVRNTGYLPLSGLAVSMDGAGLLDYTVNAAGLPASLAPGASGTFTVAFRPWQSGTRAAVLHIASNDPVQNPFNIALTGTGLTQPPPGQSVVIATAPSVVRAGSSPFSLLAGATSGLPVTYAVLTGPATISSGGLVTLTGAAGAVTIKISQAGGGGYDPAESDVTFQVTAPGEEFVKVVSGPNADHTIGIRADGTLWAWGYNNYGQLGDGTITNRSAPVQVGTAANWASAACGGSHTLAVKSDGTLWAWGWNVYGQLGDGTTTQRNSPVQVGTAANWVAVAAGAYYTLAIRSDGTLWAWGSNGRGQLGDGTATNRNSPVRIGTATNWTTVACGYEHTMAVKGDGTLWTWGYNIYGQLGDGSFTNRLSPVQVGTATDWAAVAGGIYHTLALKNDRTLWAWGNDNYGQLGDDSTTDGYTPVQIGTATNWAAVAGGNFHTVALKSDGSLWTWGYNNYGQLGYVMSTLAPNPVRLGASSSTKASACGFAHAAVVRTDGTLWTWGYNFSGQLGDGTSANRSSPVQIGTASNWAKVAGGSSHTAAVKSDGTLWAWGANSGQLGDGTTIERASPVQIGTATNWASVACGHWHTSAIKSDGTLWAWGQNTSGELGNGTTTGRTTPGQIGTATNWASVACGNFHTLAIKSDGTLWACGDNGYGQ